MKSINSLTGTTSYIPFVADPDYEYDKNLPKQGEVYSKVSAADAELYLVVVEVSLQGEGLISLQHTTYASPGSTAPTRPLNVDCFMTYHHMLTLTQLKTEYTFRGVVPLHLRGYIAKDAEQVRRWHTNDSRYVSDRLQTAGENVCSLEDLLHLRPALFEWAEDHPNKISEYGVPDDDNFWLWREYSRRTELWADENGNNVGHVHSKVETVLEKFGLRVSPFFPTTARSNEAHVSFIPDERYGQKDRRVTSKFGRFLTRSYPDLAPNTVKNIVNTFSAIDSEGYLMRIEKGWSAMRSAYLECEHESCAGRESSYYNLFSDNGIDIGEYNTVDIFDSPNVAVATLEDPDGDIIARSLVNTQRDQYVRVYPPEDCKARSALIHALEAAGYNEDRSALIGEPLAAILLPVEDESADIYMRPYLDGPNGDNLGTLIIEQDDHREAMVPIDADDFESNFHNTEALQESCLYLRYADESIDPWTIRGYLRPDYRDGGSAMLCTVVEDCLTGERIWCDKAYHVNRYSPTHQSFVRAYTRYDPSLFTAPDPEESPEHINEVISAAQQNDEFGLVTVLGKYTHFELLQPNHYVRTVTIQMSDVVYAPDYKRYFSRAQLELLAREANPVIACQFDENIVTITRLN